jgi:hypothetical protein
MQVLALLVLLFVQLANVTNAVPLLVSSPPMLTHFNHSGHPRAPLLDIVSQLNHLTARADVLHNSSLVARGHDDFRAAGLLDSLSGLPLIGGLLPIVKELLKSVESLIPIPLDSLPLVGPLLGALDTPNNGTVTATGTQSAVTPIPTLDPVAEAARLNAAASLLRAAAVELNKAVKVAEAMVVSDGAGETPTTTASEPTATSSAVVQEFSFSGRLGSS